MKGRSSKHCLLKAGFLKRRFLKTFRKIQWETPVSETRF